MSYSAHESIVSDRAMRLTIMKEGNCLQYGEVIDLWIADASFTTFFMQVLAQCPYASFKWETPPVTSDSLDQEFEWVFIDAPYLGQRRPDTIAFSLHLEKCDRQRPAAIFPNLGSDAILVAPSGIAADAYYVDLAAFSRNAPTDQQIYLWKCVGEAMKNRVGTQPVWLSTAGGGVSWLHVRLDDRPKYYGYSPYRQF